MAAITIPMLLIAWRGLRAAMQNVEPGVGAEQPRVRRGLIWLAAGSFLAANLMTIFGATWWPVELVVLLSVFTLGVRSLIRPQAEIQPASVSVDLLELAVSNGSN